MIPRRLLIPLALSLAATALVLAAAAWNRRGVETVITLTTRELSVPRMAGHHQIFVLGLNYQRDAFGTEGPRLSEETMRAIGFRCDPRLDDAEHRRPAHACARERSRLAFVVFEYDGPAFQSLVTRLERRPHDQYERETLEATRTRQSRLVPIDAGPDVSALRARYADRARYVILAAQVRPDVETHRRDAPAVLIPPRERRLRGIVEQVTPSRVSAPMMRQAELTGATPSMTPEAFPRHELRLAVGRRLEPWIEAVRPLP